MNLNSNDLTQAYTYLPSNHQDMLPYSPANAVLQQFWFCQTALIFWGLTLVVEKLAYRLKQQCVYYSHQFEVLFRFCCDCRLRLKTFLHQRQTSLPHLHMKWLPSYQHTRKCSVRRLSMENTRLQESHQHFQLLTRNHPMVIMSQGFLELTSCFLQLFQVQYTFNKILNFLNVDYQ